jgi:hypothetical protein
MQLKQNVQREKLKNKNFKIAIMVQELQVKKHSSVHRMQFKPVWKVLKYSSITNLNIHVLCSCKKQ